MVQRTDGGLRIEFVVQFCTAMGKETQRRIDFVLKRKRDDTSGDVIEDFRRVKHRNADL